MLMLAQRVEASGAKMPSQLAQCHIRCEAHGVNLDEPVKYRFRMVP